MKLKLKWAMWIAYIVFPTRLVFGYNAELKIINLNYASVYFTMTIAQQEPYAWKWVKQGQGEGIVIMEKPAYSRTFEQVTIVYLDAPKDINSGMDYVPWGLMRFTVTYGQTTLHWTLDLRDEGWSQDTTRYENPDTYIIIDWGSERVYISEDDSPGLPITGGTQEIWSYWGAGSPETGEFDYPVTLTNMISTQNAGGTLHLGGAQTSSGGDIYANPGTEVTAETDNERFPNFQGGGVTYKHNNWNLSSSDYLLRLDVTVSTPLVENATFTDLRQVRIQNKVLEASSPGPGTLQLRDPWWLNPVNHSQPDQFRNLGTPIDSGLFLAQEIVSGKPFYSVGSPLSQSIGGVESYFMEWTAHPDSASLRSPDKDTSAVVFKKAGATVTALYKGHLRSSLTSATASNSQRKIGYINAKYHMVYESAGDIWHCFSTDNGASWSQEFLVSDGTGTSRQPSLAVCQGWGSAGPVVAIAWESSSDNYSNIYVRGRNNGGSWGTANLIWYGLCDPGFEGATPAIAMEDDFQVVAWRAKRTDGWGESGIFFWLSGGGDCQFIGGTDQYSSHPSVAVRAYQTSKGHFGIAWSQSGEIYYRPYWYEIDRERLNTYSTEWPSEGSSLIEHDYPSLVYISSHGGYPSVAWQGIHHVTYISSVQVRRKTSSGWGTIQQYSLSGGDEIFHPSLTRHESPDTSLAMVMEGGGEMFLAKCTSSWGSRIDLYSGTYPSLGFDVTGNNSNFRILYTDPSTSPATIASTNESLPKLSASGSEILMRELTGVKNSVLRSVIVKNLSIKDEHSESTILFSPITDIHTISSRFEAEEYLTSEPFTIAAGQSVELTVQSSVQKKAKAAVPSATQIELLVRDASTGATLLGAVLDSLSCADSSVSVRCHTLPAGGLAGKTVRLGVFPVDGDTASGEWTATINHCDTTGVTIDGSPRVLLRPAGAAPPEQFRLYEAYPNPFNPATTLTYDLPSGGMVLLQVYNMLGQQVAELVKEYRQAGSHTVTWNASGQASGTYLAQFTLLDAIGNAKIKQVVKLILVK